MKVFIPSWDRTFLIGTKKINSHDYILVPSGTLEPGICKKWFVLFSVFTETQLHTFFYSFSFFSTRNCFWELRKYCLSNNFCKFYSKICLSKLFILRFHVARKSCCQGLGIGINVVDIPAFLGLIIFLFTETIVFLNLFNTSREKKMIKVFLGQIFL